LAPDETALEYAYPQFLKEEADELANEPDLPESLLRYPSSAYDIMSYSTPLPEKELRAFRSETLPQDVSRPRALLLMATEAALKLVTDRRLGRTWDAMKKRRDLRIEFVELVYEIYIANATLETERGVYPLHLKGKRARVEKIISLITQADRRCWFSIVMMIMRRQVVHM
jgi:hypothetical protein